MHIYYLISNCSKLGYTHDKFIPSFMKGPIQKMMPIINRGTWSRVFSFQSIIHKFLTQFPDTPKQILSLGAGFDTNYFIFKDKYPHLQFKYFEVDFFSILQKKSEMIRKDVNMLDLIIGNEVKQAKGIIYIYIYIRRRRIGLWELSDCCW